MTHLASMSLRIDCYVCAPQNTMLRHAENCNGEIADEENGTPTPKKGRRGRKRKMQTRRNDDDDDTGTVYVCLCSSSSA